MTFLYRDDSWLAVNKPSGISTHRAHGGELGLVEWLQLHHNLELHTCSRLDKETSGIILFAFTAEAAAEAQRIHEKKLAEKTYFFIAASSPQDSWKCSTPLDGKKCTSRFQKIKTGRRYSLYSARIHRGRTHQIRRHAAASGISILGDREYDGPPFVRLCLHCACVQWPEIDQELHAPTPEWFNLCINNTNDQAVISALINRRTPFLSSLTNSCRLLHRGEYSKDITVDKYAEYLLITSFRETIPAAQLLKQLAPLIALLTELSGCRGAVLKTHLRDPHKKKLFADIAVWGEAPPQSFLAREHDLFFKVQLNDRQHTGLFLDQRDSRRRIQMMCRAKRVANLFSFTCSFSIYALAGGAEVVFSVDLAAGCLNQGKENTALNNLGQSGNAKFIKEDSRKWLARQVRKKTNSPGNFTPFDLIICDPPVFASSGKGKNFHVEKEWPGLARSISEILSKDGSALFANNHQAGSKSFYLDTLSKHFTRVTKLSPPLDFPAIKGQPPHVSIFWCEK